MMQRQGQDAEGEAPAPTAAPRRRAGPAASASPFRPGQFLREVRAEMRQVAWPTRSEVINYTSVRLRHPADR